MDTGHLAGHTLTAFVAVVVTVAKAPPSLLVAVVIPILVVLWANVHGSFFLAPLILGLAWLEDRAAGGRRGGPTIPVALVSAVGIAAFGWPFRSPTSMPGPDASLR